MRYSSNISFTIVAVFIILVVSFQIINYKLSENLLLMFPTLTTIAQTITISNPRDRLIFVGDVHGQFKEFKKLLHTKIGKIDQYTTVVLLGDFLVKGPGSVQMVDYIIENEDRIKFIFGNHEVLLFLAYLQDHLVSNKFLSFTTEREFPPNSFKGPKKKHEKLVRDLGMQRLLRLADLGSAVLKFELELTNEILFAVHAGLLPGDFINKDQIPPIVELVDMKYVDEKDWTKSAREEDDLKHSKRWYKLWDDADSQYGNITVLYGHDAKKGLNLRKHTKGLDSGCVKGGSLSALEYTYNTENRCYSTTLHQVECESYV